MIHSVLELRDQALFCAWLGSTDQVPEAAGAADTQLVASRGSPGLRAWVAGDCEAERRLQAQPVPDTGASKPRRPACLPSRAATVARCSCPADRDTQPFFLPALVPSSAPTEPQPRSAHRAHSAVHFASLRFIIYSLHSLSGAKSENLRWGPWAGRAKPGRRG